VLKMERYSLFGFFLFLGQKLTIVEQSVLYFTGSFFIDFLPCSDCQILKLFTKLKLFRIPLTHIIVYIFYTICVLK